MGDRARRVLFLCTGNYYRSRFAELLFNARARARGIEWCADSAGLAPECRMRNPGPMSEAVLHELGRRHLPLAGPPRSPRDATPSELESADLLVALCEREHRPMLASLSPMAARRAVYWAIEDMYLVSPRVAMAEIAEKVEALLTELFAAKRTQPDDHAA